MNPTNIPRFLLLSAALATCLAGRISAGPKSGLEPVPRGKLCVTKGAITEISSTELEVVEPEMRGVAAYPTKQHVEAHLTYLGRTAKDKPLGSGEIRRQFGLKLRAQNGCNLVYAMWRIAPKKELVVSVKSNPGQQTHAECGTNGYTNIKPQHSSAIPALVKGAHHTLRALMEGSRMRVFIDGKNVWEGDAGQAALAFDGPVGVRTDNARFKFELFASKAEKGDGPTSCHTDQGDE